MGNFIFDAVHPGLYQALLMKFFAEVVDDSKFFTVFTKKLLRRFLTGFRIRFWIPYCFSFSVVQKEENKLSLGIFVWIHNGNLKMKTCYDIIHESGSFQIFSFHYTLLHKSLSSKCENLRRSLYTPWKHHRNFVFLTFSGGIEKSGDLFTFA